MDLDPASAYAMSEASPDRVHFLHPVSFNISLLTRVIDYMSFQNPHSKSSFQTTRPAYTTKQA